jgi:hypothetical protein
VWRERGVSEGGGVERAAPGVVGAVVVDRRVLVATEGEKKQN